MLSLNLLNGFQQVYSIFQSSACTPLYGSLVQLEFNIFMIMQIKRKDLLEEFPDILIVSKSAIERF